MQTLAEFIESYGKKYAKRIALYNKVGYRTQAITYKDLLFNAQKVSTFLLQKGVKKGDKILICAPSSAHYVQLVFGAILQGIIVVPLDIQSDLSLIKKVQQQTKAKLFFTSKKIKITIPTIQITSISEESKKLKSKKSIKTKSKDLVQILYTSGTTGMPKGVMLTNHNLMGAVNAMRKVVWLPPLKFISVLPLSHILEQVVGLLLPLSYGCSILYPQTTRPSRLSELIRIKSINAMVCVPSFLHSMQRPHIVKSLGLQFFLIAVGGAKLESSIETYWKKHFKIVLQGYGATETTAVVSGNTLFSQKKQTIGKPFPGVQVKLEKGEIWVKSPTIFSGYYLNKEKTKEVLQNGWYKTGDQGEWKGKYLKISGRKKDMIVTEGGENVFPEDIEKILNKHHDIKESCVFEKEGKIAAYLILNKEKNVDAVIKEINATLLPKQRIQKAGIWPEVSFPKTGVGKIKKFLVSQREFGKSKSKVYENGILQLISTLTDKQPKMTSKLGKDLYLDSLARVQLVALIEEQFSSEIPEHLITENTTVKELEKMIQQHKIGKHFVMNKWTINPIVVFLRRLFQQIILFPVFRYFWKVNVKGVENLKEITKPVLIMPNHESHFDVFAILKALPLKWRHKIGVAASPSVIFGISPTEQFGVGKKFLGWWSRFVLNTFPLGDQIGLERSFDITGELLDRGYSVIVFPEGHLTKDGKLQPFQQGAGLLATQMNCDVLPIGLKGLYQLHPVGNFWPKRGTVSVEFGKPMSVRGLSIPQAVNKIKKEVSTLA